MYPCFLNLTFMNIFDLRQTALEAVTRAANDFESFLPLGELDHTTIRSYFDRRREEIVAAARTALPKSADSLSLEEVLRLLYGRISKDDFPILTAD